jgi:hypothetical protein
MPEILREIPPGKLRGGRKGDFEGERALLAAIV